jgi:hypothetical protein
MTVDLSIRDSKVPRAILRSHMEIILEVLMTNTKIHSSEQDNTDTAQSLSQHKILHCTKRQDTFRINRNPPSVMTTERFFITVTTNLDATSDPESLKYCCVHRRGTQKKGAEV